MLAMGLAKYKAMGSFEERFHFMGETESTIAVAIVNNDYDFTSYTVLANENCSDVALKLGIPDYKIIEINDEVDGFEDLEKGQIIKVPTLYANRVELILRKHDLIPIEVRIFDENGLYSEYVYTHFNTNPVITAETFKSDNPAYTF
jgi:outer membrane lipoprotein-sorting protein